MFDAYMMPAFAFANCQGRALRLVRGAQISRVMLFLVLASAALAGCSRAENRAEQHYRKGMELMAKGDDLNARIEFASATRFKPDRIDAWRALVDINERLAAPTFEFQALRRVVELDPNDERSKIRLASFMLRSGAAGAALDALESVTHSDDIAEFHGTKAAILLATKDNAGALREAQRAAEIDPTNADAALILAAERASRNDLPEALKLLNGAKSTSPKDFRVPLAKVALLERTGDLPKAEAELRTQVASNPKEVALRAQLVRLLAQQRKTDDAEKELRAIAELTPDDTKPVIDLVRFIVSSRGADAGRKELQARIAKGGEVFAYQTALADLAVFERKLPEAAEILQRLTTEAKSADDKNMAKVKLAEVRMAQKDVPGAERLVAEVLNADRRNVGALRLRAAIRLDRGQVDAAIADLREALNEQPKAAEILLLMAQAYDRNGQKELADRQYADAVKATDFNPAVVLRYAAFLQRDNEQARAEEVLTQSAVRNSNSVDVLSSLAQVRLSRQNWDGAIQVADALARDPSMRSLADQLRAAALAGQKKPEESLAALERAHAAAPDALPPVISLTRTYVAQKSFDKAETLLRELQRKFPNRVEYLVMLGQVQVAKGAAPEGVKTFEAAIEQNPKSPLAYTALADFYNTRKQLDQGIAVIERGLQQMPEDNSLKMLWAGLQADRGDHEAAIGVYDAIVKQQPGALVAINNLASLLLDYRTDKESLDRAQGLVESLKGAKVPQFLDTVGWSLYLRGDHANAKPMLEQAKSQLPNVAGVRFHLGLLYRALGDETKAKEELKAASLLDTQDSDLQKKIRAALN